MIRTMLVVVALAMTAAACAPKAAAPEGRMAKPGWSPTENGALPAPMPYEAGRAIDRADAGKTIEIPLGMTFVVQLVGVPTAGYLWKPADPPAFLTAGPVTGGPTTAAQKQPGFTGGNHWEVFQFKADKPGKAKLRFEQRRPWETSEPPSDTFEVTILVK